VQGLLRRRPEVEELLDVRLRQVPALQRLWRRSGPMTVGAVHYRGTGGVDFTFRFVWLPSTDTWRVYVERQPSYESRNAGAHATHRLGLPDRPYICWTDRLTSYEDALAVAALWADATQRYIAFGRFTPPSGPRDVRDHSPLSRHSEEALRHALTDGAQTAPPPRPPTPEGRRPGFFRRLLERIG
jgi:hypothetical protein